MECTRCGSTNYGNHSKYTHKKTGEIVQRYRCKKCKKTFSDKICKFTYKDKERFLEMYLNGIGLRKAAKILGCSHPFLIRWVKELAINLRSSLEESKENFPDATLPDVIEMDEIHTRVKKGIVGSRYGVLILVGEVKLLCLW